MVTEEITFLHVCLFSRYLILNWWLCNRAQSALRHQLSTTAMALPTSSSTGAKHTQTHTARTHSCICTHIVIQRTICGRNAISKTTGVKPALHFQACPCLLCTILDFFSSYEFLCQLKCLLNKNNRRNSTAASTSPHRLSFSLPCPLCSYPFNNPSGHLCIGPRPDGNCTCRQQWLTGSCVSLANVYMHSSYV